MEPVTQYCINLEFILHDESIGEPVELLTCTNEVAAESFAKTVAQKMFIGDLRSAVEAISGNPIPANDYARIYVEKYNPIEDGPDEIMSLQIFI